MRDITLGDTAYFNFTTRSFSTGVPTALSGGSVAVLEANNNTPITANVSVQTDRASVTGLNQATVITSSGDGYEAGKSYSVYISAGNVGGVSVIGEVVAQFTIQASAAAVDLANGTDGLGALLTAVNSRLATSGYTAPDNATIAVIAGNASSIDSRLPAALVGGRMDASVGAMAADTITNTALAASAVTEIQAGLSTLDPAGIRAAIGMATANLDTQLDAIPTAAENQSGMATAAALATVAAYIDTEVAAILALVTSINAKTANLPAAPAATGDCLTAAGVRGAVGLATANLDTQLGTLATAAALSALSTLSTEIRKFLRNKRILDPVTGVETLYDDDGSALYTRNVYQDTAGLVPYADSGADRVERFA